VQEQSPGQWLFECALALTRGPLSQYLCGMVGICGRQYMQCRQQFGAMHRQKRWEDAMAWVDGHRGRQDMRGERGDAEMALLDFVCKGRSGEGL
jgi:hypothetical protein